MLGWGLQNMGLMARAGVAVLMGKATRPILV
jgi:hypothetical protein